MLSVNINARSLILCEASDRWSVAWRRATRGWDVKIVETRSILHCEAALLESPESMVGIEIVIDDMEAWARLISAVVKLQQRFSAAPFLALADRKLISAELFLRDAGFFQILYSRRDVPSAVRLLKRHLQVSQSTATTLGKE